MARTPPRHRQPSLPFPPDADEAPAPQDAGHSDAEGKSHAVQDDGSRTPPGTAGDLRAAPQPEAAHADPGALHRRAEGQPRSLDGAALPNEAGERGEPDRERGDGAGTGAASGPFAARILNGRYGAAHAG